MVNKSVFSIIFIILILICSGPAAGQPGAQRVKEEVNKLARELNMDPGEPSDNPTSGVIRKIIEFLVSPLSFLFKLGPVLAVPVIILLVFLAGSIGLRFFSHFTKERNASAQLHGIDGKANGKITESIHQQFLLEAEHLAKHNKFGEALVHLHKGSIVFLQLKRILLSAEYHTNNEIRRELRDKMEYYESYLTPFSDLARAAERKTFRSEVISPGIYKEFLEVYKKNFI